MALVDRRSSTMRGALAALAALLLQAGAARAELVVLRGGDVLKVTAFEVGEQRVRLTLPSGGVLTVPLLRVERILEDEIPLDAGVATTVAAIPTAPVSLAYRPGDPVPQTPYGELIHDTAQRHGVSPALVAAMMRVESAYDPRALSHKGARGLMQLMPATASRFGVALEELYQPERNVEAGVRYLAWLTHRFGEDPVRVIAAYNAGEGAVERHGGVPPYRETQRYVEKVLGLLGAPPERAGSGSLAVAAGAR
jgi:hypothetical protein